MGIIKYCTQRISVVLVCMIMILVGYFLAKIYQFLKIESYINYFFAQHQTFLDALLFSFVVLTILMIWYLIVDYLIRLGSRIGFLTGDESIDKSGWIFFVVICYVLMKDYISPFLMKYLC